MRTTISSGTFQPPAKRHSMSVELVSVMGLLLFSPTAQIALHRPLMLTPAGGGAAGR